MNCSQHKTKLDIDFWIILQIPMENSSFSLLTFYSFILLFILLFDRCTHIFSLLFLSFLLLFPFFVCVCVFSSSSFFLFLVVWGWGGCWRLHCKYVTKRDVQATHVPSGHPGSASRQLCKRSFLPEEHIRVHCDRRMESVNNVFCQIMQTNQQILLLPRLHSLLVALPFPNLRCHV